MKKIYLILCLLTLIGLKANAQSSSNNNNWGAAKFLGWGATSGDLPIQTNATTRMTIKDNSGWAGIGTTGPSSAVHIDGNGMGTTTGDVFRTDAPNGLTTWK